MSENFVLKSSVESNLEEPFCWLSILLNKLYIASDIPVAYAVTSSSNDCCIFRKRLCYASVETL